MSANLSYFLCANTCGGFYSLFDEITKSSDTKFIYIIKGGPGCGKSSFMRRVGGGFEALGHEVEYIYCSGDPSSLDGIYVPSLGVAYADGTAPHVLEPDYPGVSGCYLNLGEFYDTSALKGKLGEASSLARSYKAHYADAYRYLRAAGELHAPSPLLDGKVISTIERRAAGICARELPRLGGKGRLKRRFLSAFTCEGTVNRFDTVRALCERVCTIDNEQGFAPLLLERLLRHAQGAGYEVWLSPSPLFPEKPEHLLIPELSLAFLSVTSALPYDGELYKHIRLDALADKDAYRAARPALREERKLLSAVLDGAQRKLAAAKSVHDGLEMLLNPHVDFDSVYALADKHIELCK